MRSTCSAGRDRGLTLPELIVTVALVGIVVTVLSSAIIMFLRNESAVGERIDRQRGLQQLVNFLPADVASAQQIFTATPGPGALCIGGGETLLHLAWSEAFPGSQQVNTRVTYWLEDDRVLRARCETGGGDAAAVVLASGVSGVAIDGPDGAGAVAVRLDYGSTERVISATSRNAARGD